MAPSVIFTARPTVTALETLLMVLDGPSSPSMFGLLSVKGRSSRDYELLRLVRKASVVGGTGYKQRSYIYHSRYIEFE